MTARYSTESLRVSWFRVETPQALEREAKAFTMATFKMSFISDSSFLTEG